MKSNRYEILPRIRKVTGYIIGMEGIQYRCTWKDPGDLIQTKGEPLRYVEVYIGFGSTPDAALEACRSAYIQSCNRKELLADTCTPRPAYVEIPVWCKATSNLPWWRRLFRV